MRRRNALVVGGALAGLGYSLGRRWSYSAVPAYTPEFRTRLVPPAVAEPVPAEKPDIPPARTARAPRTSAARARPARPKKAKA
jgi:hypothetical protein